MTDKTSGLQFSGEPTRRAVRAGRIKQLLRDHLNGECELEDDQWELVLEALELMAGEKK